jgi:hypothetical protein
MIGAEPSRGPSFDLAGIVGIAREGKKDASRPKFDDEVPGRLADCWRSIFGDDISL